MLAVLSCRWWVYKWSKIYSFFAMFKIFPKYEVNDMTGHLFGLPFPQRSGSRWKRLGAGQLFGNTGWSNTAQPGPLGHPGSK